MTPAELTALRFAVGLATLLAVLAFGLAFAAWYRSRRWQAGLEALTGAAGTLAESVDVVSGRLREIDRRQGVEKRTVMDLTVKVTEHDDALARLHSLLAAKEAGASPTGDSAPLDYYEPKLAGCCRDVPPEHAAHDAWRQKNAAEVARRYIAMQAERAEQAQRFADDMAKHEGC